MPVTTVYNRCRTCYGGYNLLAMRFGLLLLLLYTGLVNAFWTGVSMELGTTDSDWEFDDGTREAQISMISFQLEDKAKSGLAVGVNIGYMDMRVVADSDSTAETKKFDGQYFGVYLRQPFRITDHISMQGRFSIRYYDGDESGAGEGEDDAEISWTQTMFEIGIGLRFSSLRIMPYSAYYDVDGDIDGDGTDVFEMDEALTHGIRFDYFVEDTAFIRLELVSGGYNGGYLTFVRRY